LQTSSSPLRAFAQDPPAYLPPRPGWTVLDDPHFHLSISEDGGHANVCRIRGPVELVFAEAVAAAPGARIVWLTDADGEPRLRSLGCRDQDPPLTSHVTALATTTAPPEVAGVEVRRVESYDDFLEGLAVSAAGWGTQPPAEPEAIWGRRSSRLGGEWIACLDGTPVAYAGAIAGPHGLFLTGGVTVPEARGWGAYRALVRARWDEAVTRGTPALAVHAEEASRRVLERIGFERVCDVVELVSDPSC
jgi:GNAT superfamily N-acetyltransferase